MYKKFFGLHEYPFTSSPDPKYFFPGKSHEEAFLHLQYSVSQGEGFTLITGQTGIGKTTVCRAFIECSDEQVNTAFIPYSKQNPKKLLKRICGEFAIKPRKETLKDFIDAFNNFLMQKRSEGKRVVVLLDDAHKHGKDVLEQLRLLSNLETTRDKLLQIVLIGRPELSDMLSSHDLRPLGQRVTVRYHLRPLNEHETFQYIIHRMTIAGLGLTVKFEPSATKQIYHYSNGVPQIINSVCDKALLAAFKFRHKHISGQVVKAAIKDLQSVSKFQSFRINRCYSSKLIKLYGVASILILVLFILAAVLFQREAPEIKPVIIRIKIPEPHTKNQTQKFQPSKKNNINHGEPDKKMFDTPSQIQNTPTEEKNGISGDESRQISYSIQVGAYLILKNAQDKISELNEKGYSARIVNFEDSEGRVWHTVRIGNYASRKLAQDDVKILSGRDEIEAVVLPSDKF
jgi:type II secretory pathway predicted ATPase ExeA